MRKGFGLFLVMVLLAPLVPRAQALAPACWSGPDFDIPYYTGTILPLPRQAVYRDYYLPLKKTLIVPGPELKPSDPRLQDTGRTHRAVWR